MRVRILIGMLVLVFVLPVNAQKVATEQILQEVNLDSLLLTVARLSGIEPVTINGQEQHIQTRHATKAGNEWAATYIQDRLKAWNYTTTNQYFNIDGKNILGMRKGNIHPEKAFVVCAHYDAIAGDFNKAPGADDNASGCAAVLEAARLLKDSQFPYTLFFVFFDEEEQGLLGSKSFQLQFGYDDYDILAVFNLDMIAYDDNLDMRSEIHTRPHKNSLELAAKLKSLNDTFQLGLDLQIIDPGTPDSDHSSFWDQGITAILLIEDEQDFNRYYHTSNDSMHYFHDSFFYRNTQLVIAGLVWFASNPDQDLHILPGSRNRFPVYPNPARQQITVDAGEAFEWEIHALDGRLQAHGANNAGEANIRLTGMNPGTFILRIITASGKQGSNVLVLKP